MASRKGTNVVENNRVTCLLDALTCRNRKMEACMLCSQYVYRLSYVDITWTAEKEAQQREKDHARKR